MTHDILYATYDVRYATDNIRHSLDNVILVIYLRCKIHDTRHTIRDTRRTICDTRRTICDRQYTTFARQGNSHYLLIPRLLYKYLIAIDYDCADNKFALRLIPGSSPAHSPSPHAHSPAQRRACLSDKPSNNMYRGSLSVLNDSESTRSCVLQLPPIYGGKTP